ncbi:interactor of HORMAD1 protein 1 [Anser cygnoides]|uniref:Coiled-coil domain containing 36 n=1 Tax=Anser cygnoides TaxID=8845 RepID=A0A8B9EK43_ANSCY|nr:interactor of HORMAD1 protein 1 [Anser cygnoides]
MNFNVWNIKEMLSTPTASGPNKFSVRSNAPSDYSSLSDSQLLFGSQFCPENVQSAAAPLELGTQLGQHNSQDSEPSIFTKYQTKPQLFDEDTREKGLLNFGAGRGKSVLENFEVNKNKIKDKYDREVLSTFISSINDRLQGLQVCLDKFEEMFNSRNKSILVHLETISKTLQDALQSHSDLVLKALTDKSQMEQALLEMERRLAAKDVEISDVKSSVQQLKESLESLPAQLSDQHLKLCEELGSLKLPSALAELHTFMSSARAPPRMVDDSSQTSPGTCQGCASRQETEHCPCCRGKGDCSSLGPSQHGVLPVGSQPTGDGTPGRDLSTAAGGKVSPFARAVCDRENTSVQEVRSVLGPQSCATHPCVCCANSQFLGEGQKKHCPVPQEVSLLTPLRKAIRRSTTGFKNVTPSQQRQPQVCHLFVQNNVPGQRDGNSSTDHELENVAVGSKAKQKSGRIPWNKIMERKKTYPSKRKGELFRCADGGLKQVRANRIIALGSSRKKCFPRYTVALNLENSNPVSSAPNQQMLSSAQPRLTRNFLPVPCSNRGVQQLADKTKRNVENKKRVIVSSARRNFWDSSPQENVFSLCSTTGGKQMSCSSGSSKPCPGNALPQQSMECCSLVFDSDYSD